MKNDGGPAFPIGDQSLHPLLIVAPSMACMSLRQWYAGMALQGMLANPNWTDDECAAHYAFEYADSMIAEGEK